MELKNEYPYTFKPITRIRYGVFEAILDNKDLIGRSLAEVLLSADVTSAMDIPTENIFFFVSKLPQEFTVYDEDEEDRLTKPIPINDSPAYIVEFGDRIIVGKQVKEKRLFSS